MNSLYSSVQYIKGVGPKRAKVLKKMGIENVRDLIYYFPRSYEDRGSFNKIKDCKNNEKANLKVKISGAPSISRPRRGMSIIKVPVSDGTGVAYLVWFNQNYILDSLKMGSIIKVSGKIKMKYGQIQMNSPAIEKDDGQNKRVGRIIPIYPLTKGISNNEIMKIVENALNAVVNEVDDILPKDIVESLKLYSIQNALVNIHFPKTRSDYLKAKQRLALEEFLLLQLGLYLIKHKNSHKSQGIKFDDVIEIKEFINKLPFSLTKAQQKVFNEISKDMESPKVMSRLVQGDVGSGKTIVAIMAMFKAIRSGYQAVMMAPTEILATQHYESISEMLDDYGIKCELLIGNISAKKKNDILKRTREGEIDILVGTHALIQDTVKFNKLGLVITDEQHRFGVKQRALLTQKGKNPDVLVMTATPIPRTLALILYGDLDISIIDELPPGRKKIETYATIAKMKNRVYNFIKKQVKEGRQAYIVCPLVEDSEELSLQSATELYNSLKKYFVDLRSGLLHGKMKGKEKDNIMNEFKKGNIDVLVSTTVIEVGVNVPNANIIVIENAERFGLAQLHQLRGRVGRGEYQSYCILISEGKSQIARERMKIMEQTTDGFVISEKDLKLRGPGEFFGTRQHGLPDLKIANIFTDMKLLKLSQKVASYILKQDQYLQSKKYTKLKEHIIYMFGDRIEDITLS